MTLDDLLAEMGGLSIYQAEEWEEYLACFDDAAQVGGSSPRLRHGRHASSTSGSAAAQRPHESPSELARRICSQRPAPPCGEMPRSARLVSLADLESTEIRRGIPLGVVSGCFDLLHLGHLRGIRSAKEFLRPTRPSGHVAEPVQKTGRDADNPGRLCVLVLGDEPIRVKKGPDRPILNLAERLTLLCAVRTLDYVIPLEESNALSALARLRPEHFFKSAGDLRQEVVQREAALVQSLGGRLELLADDGGGRLSTTAILAEVRRRCECHALFARRHND